MPRSFRLLETLGEGSYGVVHLAEVDAGDGFVQRLAVKWLHPRWAHDDDQLRRLGDEARLLALLNHDHIVRVHSMTKINGRLAILMEPVDGVDLSRVKAGEAVPARAVVGVVEGVADALDAAFQTPGSDGPLRVVHRDIKPSNVMVTARGGVKVMDFGVARATFETREARTRSQQFGTARYMAPERWLDAVADAPSDVFSLGITMIELLAGRPVDQPRLSPDGFGEDLARALAPLEGEVKELAARMTAYKPADRPSAREVAAKCRELRATLPGADLKDWGPGFVASCASLHSASDGEVVLEDSSDSTVSFTSAEELARTATRPMPVRRPGPWGTIVHYAGRSRDIAWSNAPAAFIMLALLVGGGTIYSYVRQWSQTAAPKVLVEAPSSADPPMVDPITAPNPPPMPIPPPPAVTDVAVVDPPPVAIPEKAHHPPPVVVPPTPDVVAPPPPPPQVLISFTFDKRYEVEVNGKSVSTANAAFYDKDALLQVVVHVPDGPPQGCTWRAEQGHVSIEPTRPGVCFKS